MLFSSFEIPSRMFGRSFTRCELQRRLFATLCLVSQIILLSDIGGISVSSLARTDRSESDSVLLLKLARNYSESDLLGSRAYNGLSFYYRQEPHNVLVLSYEALINPIHDARMSALQRLLSFSHFGDTFEERRECAFQFIEADQRIELVAAMHRYFMRYENRELVCQLRKTFNTVLKPEMFNFTRLYSHITC